MFGTCSGCCRAGAVVAGVVLIERVVVVVNALAWLRRVVVVVAAGAADDSIPIARGGCAVAVACGCGGGADSKSRFHETVTRKFAPPVRYSFQPISRSWRCGRIIWRTVRT